MKRIITTIKSILSPAYIIQTIILGGIIFLAQNYLINKWTPITAEETLKRQNLLNAKREAYLEAISIVNRIYSYSQFVVQGKEVDTTGRLRGAGYPTELEFNNCFAKLCIYSNNKQIPILFRDAIKPKSDPIVQISQLVNLIRKDLAYEDVLIDTSGDNYQYIQITPPKSN